MALQRMAFKYGVPDLLRGAGGNGGAVVYNSNTGRYEVPPFDQPVRPWYLQHSQGYVAPAPPPAQPSTTHPPAGATTTPQAPTPSPTDSPWTPGEGEGGSSPSGVDGGLGAAIGGLGLGGLGLGGLGNIGGVIGGILGGPVGSAIGNAIGGAFGGGSEASVGPSEGGPGVSGMGSAAGNAGNNDAENGISADAGPGAGDDAGDDGSDGLGAWAKGGEVELRKMAGRYGVRNPRRNFASGGLNDLSPELRGFIEADAASQGVTNPVVNFSGAPAGGGYGLQLEAPGERQTVGTPEAMRSGREVDPGLAALFAQYQRPNPYAEEIRAARERSRVEESEFNKLVDAAANTTEGGPSKAEMYFRLAAAFGAPTKTGHFAESLGAASGAMAGYEKERRESESSGRVRSFQAQLEKRKLGLQGARDELTTLRALSSQETQSQRDLAKELMKDYIASGKPQSEAGKIAIDSGMKPGTPEYNKFVQQYVQQKLESGDMYKAIMANVAQQGLALRQDTERRQTEQAARLTPTEIKLREETEDVINNAKSARKALVEALKLNPDTFTKSLGDQAQRAITDVVRPNDPRAVNTRVMENLLTGQALSQLKAIFGGAPTEGERGILLDIQGAGAKTVKERELIIRRAIDAVEAAEARNRQRLDDIKSGAYRQTTPAAKPEGDE